LKEEKAADDGTKGEVDVETCTLSAISDPRILTTGATQVEEAGRTPSPRDIRGKGSSNDRPSSKTDLPKPHINRHDKGPLSQRKDTSNDRGGAVDQSFLKSCVSQYNLAQNAQKQSPAEWIFVKQVKLSSDHT
jgi:hypothetical protein